MRYTENETRSTVLHITKHLKRKTHLQVFHGFSNAVTVLVC